MLYGPAAQLFLQLRGSSCTYESIAVSDSEGEDSDSENAIANNSVQPDNSAVTVQTNNSNNTDEQQSNILADSSASFGELAVSSSSDNVSYHESNNTIDGDTSENRNDTVASSYAPSSSNVCDEVETKPVLHTLQRFDVAEINAILNDDVSNDGENSDDDGDDTIEMVIINGVFPRPVQYSCDNIIKREDDQISGNLAYNDGSQVCTYANSCNEFLIFFSCVLFIYHM